MFDNHTYNLMTQLVEESKSLWRIKNEYQKDAGDCPGCRDFWAKMIADKEEHIQELSDMLKNHMS